MEIILSVMSVLGLNGVMLFLIKRYFDHRDKREEKESENKKELFEKIDVSLETLKLLSYARMSEEIERLLSQNYATPTERRFLKELYENYKRHGWNGDMEARLEKVYALRTDHS